MRFRKLRIAWSVFWGVACALLTVLWVRSYTIRDGFFLPVTSKFAISADSVLGHVVVWKIFASPPSTLVPYHVNHSRIEGRFKTLFNSNVLGFYFGRIAGDFRADVPHWFLVLTAAGFCVAPWLQEKWSFSLRSLLFATTLVAVALGLAVWAARK
jgi:hypothetical protein